MITTLTTSNKVKTSDQSLSYDTLQPGLKAQALTVGKRLTLGAIAAALLVTIVIITTQKIVYTVAPQVVTYITTEAIESLDFE